MRKARYLAPWHGRNTPATNDLEDSEAGALGQLKGKPAIYHCVSRVVNRDFVLQKEEKEHFVDLMKTYEAFCDLRILTFCVMSNHFHILIEVPSPPDDGTESWSDEDLLDHLGRLYSQRQTNKIRWELEHFRSQKNHEAAESLRGKYFARMWDISAYMKVLKQRFTQWFNKKHGRRGYLWEDRFKSVLVEDGHAARTMAAYIDLNPVRAGMVIDPKDYRWCGYAEAVAGSTSAREGLRLVLFEKLRTHMDDQKAASTLPSWREVVRRYRMILFADGQSSDRNRSRNRKGFTQKRVRSVLSNGGRLSEAEILHCRVRYFLDGLVVGSKDFVESSFQLSREHFSPSRRSGARKLGKVQSSLFTMRDLRIKPISMRQDS
ncbi:transposase [Haloferula sp.]|uniref:transposase n=1 Tax=Haloferula sp. TaxID=2497595 RepID=UPI0032A10E5C